MMEWIEPIARDENLQQLMQHSARTLICEGWPILCIGSWPVWEGVAQIWMFVTPEIVQHGVKTARGVRRFMEELVERDKLHRLHAWVFPQNAIAIRFVQHFGFACEGRMAKYTHKQEDMLLFARTF